MPLVVNEIRVQHVSNLSQEPIKGGEGFFPPTSALKLNNLKRKKNRRQTFSSEAGDNNDQDQSDDEQDEFDNEN